MTGGLFALAEGLLLPTSQSFFGYRTAVTTCCICICCCCCRWLRSLKVLLLQVPTAKRAG